MCSKCLEWNVEANNVATLLAELNTQGSLAATLIVTFYSLEQ